MEDVLFANSFQLQIFYFFVILTFVFLLVKNDINLFSFSIIVLFYPAIFSYFGKSFQDFYKILVLVLLVWYFLSSKSSLSARRTDSVIIISFFLFSVSFALSSYFSNDKWSIILSQYSRYFDIFLLWFIVGSWFNVLKNITKLNVLIFNIFGIQVILSILKVFIFDNFMMERNVGTLSYIGGAVGTIIPILGFIFIWFYKNGNIKFRDWLFIFGLFLVGFTTGKRAVWFIMPVVIFTFLFYIPRRINKTYISVSVIFILLIFYFGLRLTPTLNPENKIWGSFNPSFAWNYAMTYQFGDDTDTDDKLYEGRGGATLSIFNKIKGDEEFTINDIIGNGQTPMYATNYEEFDTYNYGISHKGSATGFFQTYVTLGFLGIFVTILFFTSIIFKIKDKKIRLVILFIFSWEYFLYAGTIIREPALMFMIIYFIHYSNYLYDSEQRFWLQRRMQYA